MAAAMIRYKHPRYGAIVTPYPIRFDYEWDGCRKARPFLLFQTPAPAVIPQPMEQPKPRRRVRRRRTIRYASSHNTGRPVLIKRIPDETAVRHHFGEGEQTSPYYPQRITEPVSQQTLEAHVFVPAAISAIVAVVTTTASAYLCYRNGWDYALLGYIFPGSFMGTLLWRLRVADGLLRRVEEWVQADLNGDGMIGDEPKPGAPRQVSVNRKNSSDEIELSGKPSAVSGKVWRELAIAVLCDGVDLSQNAICNRTSISQPQYLAAFGELANDGRVIFRRGAKNRLTASGWDWLSRWIPDEYQISLPYPDEIE